jgi:hypothetical protein
MHKEKVFIRRNCTVELFNKDKYFHNLFSQCNDFFLQNVKKLAESSDLKLDDENQKLNLAFQKVLEDFLNFLIFIAAEDLPNNFNHSMLLNRISIFLSHYLNSESDIGGINKDIQKYLDYLLYNLLEITSSEKIDEITEQFEKTTERVFNNCRDRRVARFVHSVISQKLVKQFEKQSPFTSYIQIPNSNVVEPILYTPIPSSSENENEKKSSKESLKCIEELEFKYFDFVGKISSFTEENQTSDDNTISGSNKFSAFHLSESNEFYWFFKTVVESLNAKKSEMIHLVLHKMMQKQFIFLTLYDFYILFCETCSELAMNQPQYPLLGKQRCATAPQ